MHKRWQVYRGGAVEPGATPASDSGGFGSAIFTEDGILCCTYKVRYWTFIAGCSKVFNKGGKPSIYGTSLRDRPFWIGVSHYFPGE
jgi:hypothetical protein